MVSVQPGLAELSPEARHELLGALGDRVRAIQLRVEENARAVHDTHAMLADTRLEARAARNLLRTSMVLRLQARLDSQPVIEQAKGILMAQTSCSPDEAFDVLRRASQRTNVPVRRLAADIVARATTGLPSRVRTSSIR